MLEQGKSFSDSSVSILVAAGPQDAQATALVWAMRDAGLRVIFAGTMTLAARASEMAVCVVVLRPYTWKTPTIATVMRARPACLIPVLAEPMDLPRGPWTHEAICLGNDPAQAAQETIQAVRDYLATRPAPVARTNSDVLTINTILKFPKSRRRLRARPLFITMLLLLIVGLGAAVGYRYYTNPFVKNPNLSRYGNLSTPAALLTYSAKTPGPNCDSGGGQWEQGDRYKKDKKTEVLDQYTTFQCQSNGGLLTRTGDYKTYSELFFDGLSHPATLTSHYFVQVDATIISGDAANWSKRSAILI